MVLSNEFGTVGLTVHWHWQGVNPFQGVLVLCHDYLRHTPALHLFHIHLGPRHVHSVFKGGQRSMHNAPRLFIVTSRLFHAYKLCLPTVSKHVVLKITIKITITTCPSCPSLWWQSTQTDPKPGTQCMWLFFHLSVKLHKNYKTRFD